MNLYIKIYKLATLVIKVFDLSIIINNLADQFLDLTF